MARPSTGPGEVMTVEKQQQLTLCISKRRGPSRRWSVHHNRKCVKIQGTICHKCTHVPLSAWKQNLTSKAMKYITMLGHAVIFFLLPFFSCCPLTNHWLYSKVFGIFCMIEELSLCVFTSILENLYAF